MEEYTLVTLAILALFGGLAGTIPAHHASTSAHRTHASTAHHTTAHHGHASTKCQTPPISFIKDDDDDDDSDSDSDEDFPDNEAPIVATYAPPNRIPDPFLDQEAEPIYFKNGPPPIVNFIGIKHRFSNDTNLAYPPFVNGFRSRGERRFRVYGLRSKGD